MSEKEECWEQDSWELTKGQEDGIWETGGGVWGGSEKNQEPYGTLFSVKKETREHIRSLSWSQGPTVTLRTCDSRSGY